MLDQIRHRITYEQLNWLKAKFTALMEPKPPAVNDETYGGDSNYNSDYHGSQTNNPNFNQ